MNRIVWMFVVAAWAAAAIAPAEAAGLRVGAAAVEVEADDSMPIAGGIHAGRAQGQEGKLRATAVVVESAGAAPVAVVSCDVLFVTRGLVEPALAEIERTCGVPAANILVHATHTHHAPSTARVHGYGPCEAFCRRLQAAIVRAAVEAHGKRAESRFSFHLGEEKTIGANSRLQLQDGTIYWVGPRDDAVGPTGPFDPDLPVLIFRSPQGALQALLYGHSTHSIGAIEPGGRSPAFYGMAAQDLERESGGVVAFLEGASGSTHALNTTGAESAQRIRRALGEALKAAAPREVDKAASLKRPFTFQVRTFDEAAEDKAVCEYCQKRIGPHAGPTIEVFRQMRKELASQQGQKRTTWVQAIRLGDVAIVGVPAELFTRLGLEIKRRSPFKNTVVAELSNDWIGYLPDREAHRLGGYQVWTGLHSYAAPGTGERLVEEAVGMLEELAR